MRMRLSTLFCIGLVSLSLMSCAIKDNHLFNSGAYHFEHGYYKRAMRDLLPAAVDGNPHAQYAVGYMYYYGYGVTQDTDAGYFWIERAARGGDAKAMLALGMISTEQYAGRRKTYSRYLPRKHDR